MQPIARLARMRSKMKLNAHVGCGPTAATLLVLWMAGCTKNVDSQSTPAARAVSSSAAGPTAPSAEATPASLPGETLMGRIAKEEHNRPSIEPRAEDVLAELAISGVGIAVRRPSLGATYHAAYCTGGYASDSAIAFTVCEYPDQASAKAGREYAKTFFPQMKNRDVWNHKATTLTIVQLKDDPATAALEKKVVASYERL
jgi:hypothetical protein